MKSRVCRSIVFAVAVTALLAGGLPGQPAHAKESDEVKVGELAPDFEMKGSDGKTYRLSDFRGKQAVVLAWYPRAFTGGCTKECISFREDGPKLRKFDVAYFTASTDPVEKNTAFAKELKVDYPILSDPDGSVAKKYGVYNADRNAALRWTFYIGEDGKVLHIDKQVKTASHGADVAERLGTLGVEQDGK